LHYFLSLNYAGALVSFSKGSQLLLFCWFHKGACYGLGGYWELASSLPLKLSLPRE